MSKPKTHAKRPPGRVIATFAPSKAAIKATTDGFPPFGVDPNDSAALLELRCAIDDYLGWSSKKDQETGDYVERIREVGRLIRRLRGELNRHGEHT